AQGARKAEIVDLDRRGPAREHVHAMLAEIAVEIDQNVDLRLADFCGRLNIVEVSNVDPGVKGPFESCGHGAWIGAAIVDGDDLKALPVVALIQARHQDGGGLVAEFSG